MPNAAAPAAPKINIKELPRKNATIETSTAILALRPKRTKSAVSVPALTKEPTTSAKATLKSKGSAGTTDFSASNPPMPCTASQTE